MMRKMGFKGKGLGKHEQGIQEPVEPGILPEKRTKRVPQGSHTPAPF